MAGITLAQAEAKLTEAQDAYSAALTSQEYAVGGKRQRRADLDALQRAIEFWESKVIRLTRSSNGGIRITGATPI